MTPQELEQFIHRNLRSLPQRRAPRSLEARVMAAIRARDLRPWYRTSWSEWPLAVRLPFLALSAGVAGAAVTAFYLMINGIEVSATAAQFSSWLGLLSKAYDAWTWVGDFAANLAGQIPPLWIYGGRLLIFTLCAIFFALCAVFYCTLYRNNWNPIPNEN